MKVILESVDGLGKTTAADKLLERFKMGYYHPPRPKKPYDKYSEKITEEYLKAIQLNDCIFDRLFYSEYAYNYSRDLSYLDDIENKINIENTVLILLYFSPVTIIKFNFRKKK